MDIETLVAHHELGAKVFAANFDGLTHDDSLVHPKGGGNCVNWVLGHLVKARNDALGLLGADPLYPPNDFDRYATGKPPLTDPGEALPFPMLQESFTSLQQPLVAALRAVSSETLARPVPDSPTGNPNETVSSFIVAIAFHEAYHLGQVGLLRRTLGKDRALP